MHIQEGWAKTATLQGLFEIMRCARRRQIWIQLTIWDLTGLTIKKMVLTGLSIKKMD